MNTRILAPTAEAIETITAALKSGNVVGIPTETVYGLAASIDSEAALSQVFAVKERPKFDPLIVHIWGEPTLSHLESFDLVNLKTFSSLAKERLEILISKFWPGPLTFVLPKTSRVSDLITAGLQTVGVRMPAHLVARQILEAVGVPLAAPSANRFGRISPTQASHVYEELEGRIPYILDGGASLVGIESTVIKMGEAGEVFLLRPGFITQKQIEDAVSHPIQVSHSQNQMAQSQMESPGQALQHYAPQTPFYLLKKPIHKMTSQDWHVLTEEHVQHRPSKIAVLAMDEKSAALAQRNLRTKSGLKTRTVALSKDGDLVEIASGLFAKLRELDHLNVSHIFSETCATKSGIGHAINDRLSRAAVRESGEFINISVYRFFKIAADQITFHRDEIKKICEELQLKGTVLLAHEGLNAFLSGPRDSIDVIKNIFNKIAGESLPFKESPSTHQPFTRLLVKIKKEIITTGKPEVSPQLKTGERVTPKELKTWLDQGRKLVLLDTRNDYEVHLGTFKNAKQMDLKTFRQFPKRIEEMLKEMKDELQDHTIVTFCTGGIRCEKATAIMLDLGIKNVFQLDGGILKYFEETGGEHYVGECFVFDHRVSVDANLRQTKAVLCYVCQNPVSEKEQLSPRYIAHESCPHCFGRPKVHKEKIAESLK